MCLKNHQAFQPICLLTCQSFSSTENQFWVYSRVRASLCCPALTLKSQYCHSFLSEQLGLRECAVPSCFCFARFHPQDGMGASCLLGNKCSLPSSIPRKQKRHVRFWLQVIRIHNEYRLDKYSKLYKLPASSHSWKTVIKSYLTQHQREFIALDHLDCQLQYTYLIFRQHFAVLKLFLHYPVISASVLFMKEEMKVGSRQHTCEKLITFCSSLKCAMLQVLC